MLFISSGATFRCLILLKEEACLCALCQMCSPGNCKCLFKVTKTKSRGGQPLLVGGRNVAYVSPFNTARQLCRSCKLPCKNKEKYHHICLLSFKLVIEQCFLNSSDTTEEEQTGFKTYRKICVTFVLKVEIQCHGNKQSQFKIPKQALNTLSCFFLEIQSGHKNYSLQSTLSAMKFTAAKFNIFYIAGPLLSLE